jgi:hypothetical protein
VRCKAEKVTFITNQYAWPQKSTLVKCLGKSRNSRIIKIIKLECMQEAFGTYFLTDILYLAGIFGL